MKAIKIAGVRLINYLEDGINWKDHADIVLDFWITYKCRKYGYNPRQFNNMFYIEELPIKAQEDYKAWFEEYDFQNDDDKDWLKFVDGTLNLFYHTKDPQIMPEDTWYLVGMKSEVKAREICETQIFHGDPNIQSFWKLETNTKSDEVGGRRNGYIYSVELELVEPKHLKDYYWAVIFQCPPDTVKLHYENEGKLKHKCINWAADCKHMTLLQVTDSGRFLIEQVFVKGKAWRDDRYVPQDKVPPNPMTGTTLLKHIQQNYYDMYGLWDEIDETKKDMNQAINERKASINTMNDEEVEVAKVIDDVQDFIIDGNISPEKRQYNKQIRQNIREKNKLRDREIKKKMREKIKDKRKSDRKDRNKLNPLFKKGFD